MNDEKSLKEYLNILSEMRIVDLMELNKKKIQSLKDDIGLLWHCRLGHISRTYLEKSAKVLPELKNIKLNNSPLQNVKSVKRLKLKKIQTI